MRALRAIIGNLKEYQVCSSGAARLEARLWRERVFNRARATRAECDSSGARREVARLKLERKISLANDLCQFTGLCVCCSIKAEVDGLRRAAPSEQPGG
jgi:hypothetical protein